MSSSSNSYASTEFESARAEGENTMRSGEAKDFFDSSSCEEAEWKKTEVGGESEQGSSTGPRRERNMTAKEVDEVWKQLPEGARMIAEKATGMLYIERYESFISNNWPYDVKRRALCHPKALAMAGLGFHSLTPKPAAQCQVCLTILMDLKANSNPWILHSEANPECTLIKLGQRQEVDDYTIDQLLEMAYKKIYNIAKQKVQEKENELKRKLCALRELEIQREKAKQKMDAKKQKQKIKSKKQQQQ